MVIDWSQVLSLVSTYGLPVAVVVFLVVADLKRSARSSLETLNLPSDVRPVFIAPAPPDQAGRKCEHCGTTPQKDGRCVSCGAPRTETADEPMVLTHHCSRSGARVEDWRDA